MKFKLSKLTYDYQALEPWIDKNTMEIHHQKHHQGYINKLNAALEGTDLEGNPIEKILERISRYPAAIRNNAGGVYNHTLFWQILNPARSEKPANNLPVQIALSKEFQSMEAFRQTFKEKALGLFGSGWIWLCADPNDHSLFLVTTPNQDNPLMDDAERQGIPLIGLDLWEHAYYLKYQNRRADYIDAFFNVLNWEVVNRRYQTASAHALAV